ncbi:MAG: DUF4386 domain-containing protein [Rhizobiales bacterium]|nr:DUF4386 domain-containing protein [Hyphomicrobiales bacterium]
MQQINKPKTHFNYARLAGLSYLGLIICGIYTEFFVRGKLYIKGDVAATITNIQADELLFRFGFLTDLMMMFFGVMMALGFYMLFRPVNKGLSLFTLFLNLAWVPILAFNMLNQLDILLLVNNSEYIASFSSEQIHAMIGHLLERRDMGYVIAQTFFGPWCLAVGYLVYTSGFMSKILGVVVMVAVIDHLSWYLAGIFNLDSPWVQYFSYIGLTGIGEIVLCIYLVIMGGYVHKGYLKRLKLSHVDY